MSGYTTLTGATLVVPILGDPIAQVKSPDGISRIFADRGLNAVCIPLQAATGDIDLLLDGLSVSASIAGLIGTVPHKFDLATHCATLSDRAAFLGSVNVARRNADGSWYGDQVDGEAFVAAVKVAATGAGLAADFPAGARALQIGAGGAGSAIAYALLEHGVAELALVDADQSRRDALVARLRERFGDRVVPGTPDPTGRDLVANATPMGMRPDDPMPFDVRALAASTLVGDVVTKPAVPALIAAARALGCPTSTGTDMFGQVGGLIVDVLAAIGPLATTDNCPHRQDNSVPGRHR